MRSLVRRTTLLISDVNVDAGDGSRVQGRGEVWLGPINVGDVFVAAMRDDEETPCQLRVHGQSTAGAPVTSARSGKLIDFVLIVEAAACALGPGVLLVGEQVGDT